MPCDALKAAFDKLVAAVALAAVSPLFAAIAAAIKLEGLLDRSARGPVLYSQVRVTEGREFPLFKFRITRNSVLEEEPEKRRRDRFKTLEQDAYCTRVGRYLKKWYLDELPQILNILRGEMSWVGPRPFPYQDYLEDLRLGRYQKKVIRAGLSGLVQIHKGVATGKTDIQLDDEYIEACRRANPLQRFRYDLSILARTVGTVLAGKGL